jgi:hypothetical protein
MVYTSYITTPAMLFSCLNTLYLAPRNPTFALIREIRLTMKPILITAALTQFGYSICISKAMPLGSGPAIRPRLCEALLKSIVNPCSRVVCREVNAEMAGDKIG